jgi:hypothetical protein
MTLEQPEPVILAWHTPVAGPAQRAEEDHRRRHLLTQADSQQGRVISPVRPPG